jgi:hypothetical protein
MYGGLVVRGKMAKEMRGNDCFFKTVKRKGYIPFR